MWTGCSLSVLSGVVDFLTECTMALLVAAYHRSTVRDSFTLVLVLANFKQDFINIFASLLYGLHCVQVCNALARQYFTAELRGRFGFIFESKNFIAGNKAVEFFSDLSYER